MYRLAPLVFLLIILLSLPMVGEAAALARVGEEEVTTLEVEVLARLLLKVEGETIEEAKFQEALQKTITNRAISMRARIESPKLVATVVELVELELAKDYYAPYYAMVAYPQAMKEVTLETVIEETPEQEAVVYLYQITMTDKEALTKVREEVVSGAITFQEAAKKHSAGISAVKGGEVGGVKESDDRFIGKTKEVLFLMKKGEVSEVTVMHPFGYAIFWAKDYKTREEHRSFLAAGELEGKRGGRAAQIVSEKVDSWLESGRAKIFTDNLSGKSDFDPKAKAFQVDDSVYTIGSIIANSGGAGSHGKKDIISIVKKRCRDVVARKLYLETKGTINEEPVRKKILTEHYSTRRYLKKKSADLVISSEEVTQYISENPEKYRLPHRADLSLVYVKTQERMDQVLSRLEQGISFEEVAKAWSQDERSGRVGGKLGLVTLAAIEGNFSEMKPGVVTDPYQVTEGDMQGYYLLRINELYPEEAGTMENLGAEVLGGVRSILLSHKKEKRVFGLVDEIMSEVKIEIY